MTPHPVQFRVPVPEQMQRIHVVIRLLLLAALGTLGCSSLYWLLYLSIPALAALMLSTKGFERYFAEDAPQLTRALRWLAAAYAYLWLLTDAAPTSQESGPVELQIETSGTPTTGSALLRLFTSIPSLLLLAILSFAAGVLWVIGAIVILLRARPSAGIADYLALTLRYQFRLVAYHLSLVDRYPSLESAPAGHDAAQLGAV
ncbi:MAG: DUF4389 domain-containing protein [Polyangia bacterium]